MAASNGPINNFSEYPSCSNENMFASWTSCALIVLPGFPFAYAGVTPNLRQQQRKQYDHRDKFSHFYEYLLLETCTVPII